MFKNGYILLDGAMGTNLYKRGLPGGVCVEQWNLEHPEVFCDIQRSYIEAGSDVIYAPTFGANRISLSAYGLEASVYEFNKKLTELTVKNVGGRCITAASVTTTGAFVKPFGEMDIDSLADVYYEQISAIKDGGAELVVGETLMSISDLRAFAMAAKKAGMPFAVTVTVDASGRTLSGMSAAAAIVAAQALGASAAGVNCSEGPETVYNALSDAIRFANIPVIAKPNGGLPEAPLSVDEFICGCNKLLDLGVTVIGGCCGTDKDYIAALRHAVDQRKNDFKIPHSCINALADWQNAYVIPDEPKLSEVCVCNTADDVFVFDFGDCDVALIGFSSAEVASEVAPELFSLGRPVAFVGDENIVKSASVAYDGIAATADGNNLIFN